MLENYRHLKDDHIVETFGPHVLAMTLLIVGHGDHGKDTAAEMISEATGKDFISSSQFCCERVVFPALAPIYGYETPEQCFNDRHSHREEWKQLISDYNSPDKARLAKMVLKECPIYVGMRCDKEYAASKELFDLVIWVDASERKPKDPTMKIEREPSMWVLDNNQDLFHLDRQVRHMVDSGVIS